MGLCYTICHLYLSLYLAIGNVFSRLLKQIARMDIDNLKQLGEPFLSFNTVPARISKTLSWLVLPDKICLMSTSYLYRSFCVR